MAHRHCWHPLKKTFLVHRCCRCPDVLLNTSGLEMEEKTHGGIGASAPWEGAVHVMVRNHPPMHFGAHIAGLPGE